MQCIYAATKIILELLLSLIHLKGQAMTSLLWHLGVCLTRFTIRAKKVPKK